MIEKYEVFYEDAMRYKEEFMTYSELDVSCPSKEEFIELMKNEDKTTRIPKKGSEAYTAYLIFKIISDSSETEIGAKINEWLTSL